MDHHSIYWPTLLIALNIILYHRTLSYGIVIDDIEWYDKIRQGIFQRAPWTRLYSHWGLSYPIEHTITLSLHIITVLLISVISPLGALLYSAHPCNHQTAIWINGRRYSYLNILVLSMVLLHVWWILPIVAIPLVRYTYYQLHPRLHLPQPHGSLWKTFIMCLGKLSGFYRYSFIYPDGPAPFLPHTQPVAERYLSLPLILYCIAISYIPVIFIYPLFALYALSTWRLQIMYKSIQSFYDYHSCLYPGLSKLSLLKRLYPEIET